MTPQASGFACLNILNGTKEQEFAIEAIAKVILVELRIYIPEEDKRSERGEFVYMFTKNGHPNTPVIKKGFYMLLF